MVRNNLAGLFVLALAAEVWGTGAAWAAPAVRDLGTCQRLAEHSPAEALTAVKEWASHGGGDQARLCRAAALFQNGEFTAAGEVFESLTATARSDRQIAELYDRAAWAFLRGGDAARADYLYSRALDRLPDNPEMLVDRGIARTEIRKYREAVADFTAALSHQANRPDVYFYRAAAYRELMDLKSARADLEQSLRLRPGDAETLVLRGTVRSQAGDAAGARLDWQEVIRRDPGSPTGKAAAAALRRLDEPAQPPAQAPR